MREIQLTRGKFARVDDDDHEWLSQWSWCAYKPPRKGVQTFYAMRVQRLPDGKKRAVWMHRQILGEPKLDVDHRDLDGLNNQRHNLRESTKSQNKANVRKKPGCSSRFKGVTWHSIGKKWQAKIQCQSKQKHLGLFRTQTAAARAYNTAAKLLFGEFARLNRVLEVAA